MEKMSKTFLRRLNIILNIILIYLILSYCLGIPGAIFVYSFGAH